MQKAGGGGENRAGAERVRGAEESDERHAEGVCEMHAAGVIGHKQAAFSEMIGVGDEVGAPGEVSDLGGRKTGGDRGGDRGITVGAIKHETMLGQAVDESPPMVDGPAFLGVVFGAGNQRDRQTRLLGAGADRRTVGSDFKAEVAEHVFPDGSLMTAGLVELGGRTIGVGEQRAPVTGAHQAEALGTAGEPRFDIAAERVGEQEDDVWKARAKAPEVKKIADALFG